MKTPRKTSSPAIHTKARTLTLGDLIAATYGACGEKTASSILHLALESHVVRFKGPSGFGYLHG